MRFEAVLGALVILTDLSGAAHADLVGRPKDPPQFSAADSRLIGRNELLRAIVAEDPWLVRHILDLLKQRDVAPRQSSQTTSGEHIDPARNPDLTAAGRTAEGSVEWLELLRRARAEKETREKEPIAASGRTAEGSIELIEMMKKAKAAKEAVGK
jgi:hypothetical protein